MRANLWLLCRRDDNDVLVEIYSEDDKEVIEYAKETLPGGTEDYETDIQGERIDILIPGPDPVIVDTVKKHHSKGWVYELWRHHIGKA